MEVEKVKRQANWTMEECLFLVTAVKEGFAVVKGKFGPCLTSKMKKDRWETISRDLSAQFGSNRTSEQTEKKWSNLMAKAKPLISEYRRESQRTGMVSILPNFIYFVVYRLMISRIQLWFTFTASGAPDNPIKFYNSMSSFERSITLNLLPCC